MATGLVGPKILEHELFTESTVKPLSCRYQRVRTVCPYFVAVCVTVVDIVKQSGFSGLFIGIVDVFVRRSSTVDCRIPKTRM